MTPFISVSIVTYNTSAEMLTKVLNSLRRSSLNPKVMIVDNSPTDALRELVKSYGFDYELTGENVGFSKAHNKAIRHFLDSSKYHIVLNPDVSFEEDTIKILFNYMEKNKDVGLVMPKILYPDGTIQRHCRLLPTPFDLIVRRFIPFQALVERRNHKYELQFADYNREMDVPCLAGNFMFIRNEALKMVGLFDEHFFLYLEDYDLCRRIGEKFRTVYYPKTTIIHEYARGSYKNLKLLRHHIGSAIYYFSKTGWFKDVYRKKRNQAALEKLEYRRA
ncbi:MAG: glycosyl transferase, family 2 [Bacteriovoracaceae bacterium]|nr:glycosyl transferase, family 2 [Bacteriovoracaceae bacterium]